MNNDALVRLITEAVLARLSAQATQGFTWDPGVTKRKKILVPLSGLPNPAELFWRRLGELDSNKVELIFAYAPALQASGIRDQIAMVHGGHAELSLESVERLLPQAEIILVPFFTLSHLGKVVNLIMDDGVTAAVLQGIWEGKTVLVSPELLMAAKARTAKLPAGFFERLQGHFNLLQGFGVKFLEPDRLQEQLSNLPALPAANGKRTVVTLDDIKALVTSGHKPIRLAWGTIVTPLAREFCRDAGIDIEFV